MVDDAQPRVHGGMTSAPRDRAGRDQRGTIVDMSTCVDAFGLFEPVRRALQNVEATASYRHYPDPDSRLARGRLAEVSDVTADNIDVAPGAAELIWTLTRTILRSGEAAMAWKPCFSEFEHAVAAVGGRLLSNESQWGGTMESEVARFADAVAKQRPKLAYLCAPTCPRGEWVPAQLLREVTIAFPDTTFVIDQSYLNLSAHAAELAVRFPNNVVLLRSITKELGLPGVRVGYAVLGAEQRRRLQAQRPYWSVGAHAQAVLEVYVECLPLLETRRGVLLAQAQQLAANLRGAGLEPSLRDTHYFTVASRDRERRGVQSAATIARLLLQEGAVAVRDCTSFGMPGHVRVVAHPEQARLLSAWSLLASAELGGAQ